MAHKQPPTATTANLNRALVTIGLVVALIVIVAFGYYLWHHHHSAMAPSAHPSAEQQQAAADDYFEHRKFDATVLIKPTGYEPLTLQIKPQTGVTFENHDTKIHRLVFTPGGLAPSYFKQNRDIQPDETAGARFDTPGTYHYHDPLDPKLNGIIVVTQP